MTTTPTFTSRLFLTFFYILAAAALVSSGAKSWTLALCFGLLSLFFLGMNRLEMVRLARLKSKSSSPDHARSAGVSTAVVSDPPSSPTRPSDQTSIYQDEQPDEEPPTALETLHLLIQDQDTGYEEQVLELIGQCENIDDVLFVSHHETTALHLAILNLCPAPVLSALIKAGGTAPIAVAAEEAWLRNYIENGVSVETLRIVLDMGVDPNAVHDDDYTPTYIAIEEDRADLVELLIKYGAKPQDEENENWLGNAIERGQNNIVALLLSSPSIRAALDLNSGLSLALLEDNWVSVCKLLEYGVDPMSREVVQETTVSVALQGEVSEVLTLAMPLSHNDRWRLLGHVQALAEDSTTVELTEAWLDKLMSLEAAWEMGYGDPQKDFIFHSSIDPTLIDKASSLVAAQSLVLSGIDPFVGPNSLFVQAVNARNPYIVATYLESLSQELAQEKLSELGDAQWVHFAAALLNFRRFLRTRYINSR